MGFRVSGVMRVSSCKLVRVSEEVPLKGTLKVS